MQEMMSVEQQVENLGGGSDLMSTMESSQSLTSVTGLDANCQGCKLALEEGGDPVVVILGDKFWHTEWYVTSISQTINHFPPYFQISKLVSVQPIPLVTLKLQV
jgi:hypothetical protein